MDAFFVKTYEYEHPYFLRLWCSSTFEGSSLLLTFDGVKIRLINFLSHQTIKEIDFLNHQSLSYVTSIYHPGYPSKAIFLFVRDRRNIWAYDDQLVNIPSLTIDTSLIILAMVWSQQKQILYISGNFGWMRALKIKVSTSISGNICEWIPVWTKHESGQWMQHLALDEPRGYLFGASGIDVFVWSLIDGQLLLQYDSKHTHAITSLRYSSDHLLLFTASSDGTIKIWRIFERKPDLIRTLKQIDLGPMLLEIDSSTIISMSCERILRRYNMMNGSVLGSLDLDPSVSIDQKNIDSPLKIDIGYTENVHGQHEWLFESEGFKISVFEVHYAPRELAICCDIVSHMVVDPESTVYAVCRNGVLHVLHTDASEQRTVDLDTIPLTNDPDHILNPSTILHIEYANGYVYLAYESGEIKALNTKTFEFFKMREPDLGKSITSLCTTNDILTSRHNYCPASADLHSLVLSCSSNGGFTVHCALCYNFIASWKLSNSKIIQMRVVPNKKLLAAIDTTHLYIYKESNNMLAKACSFEFEEEEYASCFTFASDNVIVVGMVSGKGTIIDFNENEDGTFSLSQRLIIRMHSHQISTILSCADLKKIDECKDIYDTFNLDGIVCSIGVDDTLKVTDCFTGVLQYFTVLPVHANAHTATFVYQAKIMLAISIDQNIRLFDWPGFERLLPSTHESPRSEPETPHIRRPLSSSSYDDYSDDDYRYRSSNSFNNSNNNNQKTNNFNSLLFGENQRNSSEVKLNETDNEETVDVEINSNQQIKKKQRIDLVFENGFPKLKFSNIIENSEEEETIENNEEEEEEETNKEVEIKEDFYLNDILKEPSRDEAIEKNRQIFQKVISNDPEIADTIINKRVKKITRITEDDIDEDEFYNYLFKPNVKHYEQKKKENKEKFQPQQPQQFKFRGLPLEKPEKIPKIGARKKTKTTGRTKHFVILEFENGKQLKTSELTIDMLKEIAMANNKVEEETVTDLTPGWVFQKALTDLTQNKRHQPKTLLIRQQELVALPIFTLTSGGVNVGAYYRRFFTNKPSKKFYEERYTPSNITHLKDGQVHVNRFMHWEGVEFDHLTKKSNVIGMRTVVEEIPVQGEEEEENEVEDDDEDEACSLISEILRKARKSRRAKLKLNPKHDTYDSMSFDPNSFNSNDLNNHGEFNFFEKDNPLSKALVTASPSVSAITQMINENDDNPLLSLISSTPFVSPAQLLAQVDDDRMSQIAMWQRQTGDDVAIPNIVNTFTFEGLSDKFRAANDSNTRVASPRAVDALAELTKRMEINQPLLPIISEDSFNELSADSSSASDTSSDDDDEDDEELIFLKSQLPTKLMRTQSIIQEHLQRNDFKTLKDALNDAGLICENGLIDLPRWQPTVNFMIRHQKGIHPFLLSVQTDDKINDKNISTSNNNKNQTVVTNDDNDTNESGITHYASNSPMRTLNENKYRARQKKPRKSYSKSLSIDKRKITNENETENDSKDSEEVENTTSENDDYEKENQNENENEKIEEEEEDDKKEEEEEEEDDDLNDILASVNNNKAKEYISKIDLNKGIGGSSNYLLLKKKKQTTTNSTSTPNRNNEKALRTTPQKIRKSPKKLEKDFGLSRDGKKLYKIPKGGGFNKDNFEKYDPIEEIRIKTKNKRRQKLMAELLPSSKMFKSTTIKSLLKERPEHIEIDFGDPKLYQAGVKKYYIKNLLKKGPRFQPHKVGTKNPLLMAHGSDSDDDHPVYDEMIKKVDLKKIKHSKSYNVMPLPRLSPRDDDDKSLLQLLQDEELEELIDRIIEEEEEDEAEDLYDNIENENENEELEENEDENEELEEEEQIEYEYEYEYDNTDRSKKIKKKKQKKIKKVPKKRLKTDIAKLKDIPEPIVNLKNHANSSSRSSSSSRKSSRSSSRSSSRMSSRMAMKKKLLSSFPKIPSDDEGDSNLIIGTLKSNAKSPNRRRRTIPKKPMKNNTEELESKIDHNDEDLVKEMDELLKDAEDKEEVPPSKSGEEEEEIKNVKNNEEEDVLMPLPEESSTPDSSKKLKKKMSKVRKSKLGSKSDFGVDDDEARELFESLLQATQTSTQTIGSSGSDLSSLLNLEALRQNQNGMENRKFGQNVKLKKKNEFQSTKRKKIITIKKFDWDMNLKIRSASTNNLLTKEKRIYERRKMFMLGRINMIVAPDIFLSYAAQTLWNQDNGKMRRNSFDISTKEMKKY